MPLLAPRLPAEVNEHGGCRVSSVVSYGPMRSSEEVSRLVRARSPLPPAETERVIRGFFVPARAVGFVCETHDLGRKAVLDIGCSHGQHLMHFGPGSAGIDAVERNVEFSRALGFQTV